MKLVRAIVGICFAASAVLFTYLISSQPVQATGGIWYVASNGNDSNDCASPATPCATINGALNEPTFNPGDTVIVASGIYTDSGFEVVTLNNNVKLLGGWDAGFSAQAGYSIIDGQNARRGITVYGLVNASIDHFIIQHSSADQGAGIYNNGGITITRTTIQNNVATSGSADGGGIYNAGSGSLTIVFSTISSNQAGNGAGINQNGGTVVIYNSAIINNVAINNGGGIYQDNNATTYLNNATVGDNQATIGGGINTYSGTLSLNSTTIAHNSANSGGGINRASGTSLVALRNTIVASNTAVSGPDCVGTINSNAYNLIGTISGCGYVPVAGDYLGVNSKLGMLIGSPAYYPLLPTSIAIDHGNPVNCIDYLGIPLTTDQRGISRVGRCDIGAYEYITPTAAVSILTVSGTPQHANLNSVYAEPLLAAVLDSAGSPVSGTLVTFSAPNSGPSVTFTGSGTYTETRITDGSGVAVSTNIIANSTLGAFTATAKASGIIPPANFLLRNGPWLVATTGNDSNDCVTTSTPCATIDGVIAKSGFAPGDMVYAASGLYTNTGNEVTLINRNVKLLGGWDPGFNSQSGLSTIDGQGVRRGLNIINATVSIDHFIVQHGHNVSTIYGGGILASNSVVTITQSVIRDNVTTGNNEGDGAGMYQDGGTLNVFNSSFIGNIVVNGTGGNGGALFQNGGVANFNNVTVANNQAGFGGGGFGVQNATLNLNNTTVVNNIVTSSQGGAITINFNQGTVNLQNTILAGNSAPWAPECTGPVTSLGYNLVDNINGCTYTSGVGDLLGVDPHLGTLTGAIPYYPLQISSPAINAGNPAGCADNFGNPLPLDQRGLPRVGRCDIGAVETQALEGSYKAVYAPRLQPNQIVTYTIHLAAISGTVASNTSIVDVIPLSLTYQAGSLVANGGSYGYSNRIITWTGEISSGSPINIAYATRIDPLMPINSIVTNTAVIDSNSQIFSRSVTLNIPRVWYVANSGNDINDCMTALTPCATIDGVMAKPSFTAGNIVYVASGSYTGVGNQVSLISRDVKLLGGWDTNFVSQSGLSTIDGQGVRRGLNIISATVTIDHFVVQNGHSIITNIGGGILTSNSVLSIEHSLIKNNVADNGAGIYQTGGTLNIDTSALLENTAGSGTSGDGGALYQNGGMANLTNDTIAKNQAGYGGAGFGLYNATLNLNNSTVAYNVGNRGGAVTIDFDQGLVNLQNTIMAGNSAASGPECTGPVTSLGYNLVDNINGCTYTSGVGDLLGVDPHLGTLTGAIPYYPLQISSPAIDAGNPAGCTDNFGNPLPLDQRGLPRVGRCDIGAVESQIMVHRVYLPLIQKPAPLKGIYGMVTDHGAAATVALDLRFYDGSTWSTRASTTTAADGSYSFLGMPSLSSGQAYYVRYLNTTASSRLYTWHTRSLNAYASGSESHIGDFDVANIALVAPAPGAAVSLPRVFQWSRRPNTTSDSYEFDLFDPQDGNPYFFTNPPLGYVSSYTLNGLPSGFKVNTQYAWDIWVYGPDGGYGTSYYAYYVKFSTVGLEVTSIQRSREPLRLDDFVYPTILKTVGSSGRKR